MSNLTMELPKAQEIVEFLDQWVIGQHQAKRQVAVALRQRMLRLQLEPELQEEVIPKNILMFGPTGVGKTEIVRRLAKMIDAPFWQVEATKYTEVGYVGRDVDGIVRDLMEHAIKHTRQQALAEVRKAATAQALERVWELAREQLEGVGELAEFCSQYESNQWQEQIIEIESPQARVDVEIVSSSGLEDITQQLQQAFQSLGQGQQQRRRSKKLPLADAVSLLTEEEAFQLVDEEQVRSQAVRRVECLGIVCIDEFDKICQTHERLQGDVSREGVQRDLLPLLGGCTVSTRYGPVKTNHILFIACGAFHFAKPSDLIPELQGRLPVRIELTGLNAQDFSAILTQRRASLLEQCKALLRCEGIDICYTSEAVDRIAQVAWEWNAAGENLGARRLFAVVEKLFEHLFYDPEPGELLVDEEFVATRLRDVVSCEGLSEWII